VHGVTAALTVPLMRAVRSPACQSGRRSNAPPGRQHRHRLAPLRRPPRCGNMVAQGAPRAHMTQGAACTALPRGCRMPEPGCGDASTAGCSDGAARAAQKQARRAPQRTVHARDRGRRVGLGQPRLGDPHGRPVRLADALACRRGRAGLRAGGGPRVGGLGCGGRPRVPGGLSQLRARRAGPCSAADRAGAAAAARSTSAWTGGGEAGARRACGNMPASAGCRRFHARDARASSRFSASCRRAAARGIRCRV
jgi:hypothetical protein